MNTASTRRLRHWLVGLLLLALSWCAAPALAGPVDWQELTPTAEGRQWWDAGSLRINRDGNLTVLSRFQPAASSDDERARPPASSLYVMEIDCGQTLFRDTSINGFRQWNSSWQPAGADGLIEETIAAVCAAGAELLAGA
ncbi:MAG: hypothetical protein VKJ66_09915 [Synechococcus sp.]|nr:hypothetical protein [Synechococcus sp.]